MQSGQQHPLSAFTRKILVKEENGTNKAEIWYCPEDERRKIVKELNISPISENVNLRDIVTKMKLFSFHGKTRKYFVGYAILLMKMLYTCCKIKERTTDIKLFKSLVTQTLGIEFNETIALFREALQFIYSTENVI